MLGVVLIFVVVSEGVISDIKVEVVSNEFCLE